MEKVKNWFFENKYNFLIISIFIFVLTFAPSLDSDSFWHLKTGEWILENGFPQKDMFSYWDSEFIAHEWLFDVVAFKIYDLFGYQSLMILRVLILGTILWVSLKLAKKRGMGNSFVAMSALIFIVLAAKMFIVRPQILSALFICLEIYILENYKKPWILPILSLIFANIHGGLIFVFCLIYLVYLFSDIWNKTISKKEILTKILIFMGIILTVFITPYGADCALYGSKMPGYVRDVITEFFPIIKSEEDIFLLLFMFLPIACMAYVKNVDIKDILMFSMGFLMSILWIRMITIFIFIYIIYGCPYIYKILIEVKEKFNVKDFEISNNILKYCQIMYGIFICGLAGFFIVSTVGFTMSTSLENDIKKESLSKYAPMEIVNYLKDNVNSESEIVMNHYNLGGYLLFNDLPVFVDGRTDVYLEEYGNKPVYNDYTDIINAEENVDILIDEYDIDYFAIYKDDELFDYLINNNLSEIVVEDGEAVLLKKLVN